MLKVESLEISGFKSFVDPVVVELAGGITAIVGRIVDVIRRAHGLEPVLTMEG